MLTVAEIARIGVGLRRHGIATIKLSGGEPTTRDDLPQIVGVLGHQGIKPIIVTNGISIHDSVLTSLRETNGELKFSIHWPGSGNDLVLRVPSFTQILTNIRAARRRLVPFSINTVITPKSAHVMLQMVVFAIDQGARKISFIPVVPRGRARARAEFEFDPLTLATVRAEIDEISRKFKSHIDVRCIDFRARDYWVVENDGSLWIEKAKDDDDVLICQKGELMAL